MKYLLSLSFLLHSILSFTQTDTLILSHKSLIYFDSGKADIRQDQQNVLDSLISGFLNYTNPRIKIIAHTDLVGNGQNNMYLSKSRADSVKYYFIKNKINSDIIETEYFGEERPVEKAINNLDKQQNRRAEILIYSRHPRQVIMGKVLDDSTNLGISAQIRMHSKFWTDTAQANENGEFEILVPKNKVFGLDITAESYLIETLMLKAKPIFAKEAIKIQLERLAIGKSFKLEELYFVGGRDLLLPKSFRSLQILDAFMQSNKESCIEIQGHINLPNEPRTTPDTRNHDLSIARARRIKNYLISNNIREDRILFKGYGNWEMEYPNTDIELEMAMNRRVEIEVIDCNRLKAEKSDSLSANSEFYFFQIQNYSVGK